MPDTEQNRTETKPFRWTRQRDKAALLCADDKLTDEAIAAELGIGRTTLHEWRQHPDFKARITEHVDAYRAAIRSKGIAILENRVAALQDRWDRMKAVIEARAEEYEDAAPGVDTGLVVKQLKMIGKGNSAQLVTEWAVDTGLLRELREHEKQAAQELRQWIDQTEHSGSVDFNITGAREDLDRRLALRAERSRAPDPAGEPDG